MTSNPKHDDVMKGKTIEANNHTKPETIAQGFRNYT